MIDLLAISLALTIPGALAGGLTAFVVVRRAGRADPAPPAEPKPVGPPVIAPDIERLARSWTNQMGRPEATHIVAAKLQALADLADRRGWR